MHKTTQSSIKIPKTKLSCRCCHVKFNDPLKSHAKQHLLNNLPFCYNCRSLFREFWKGIVLKCKDKLKKEFDNWRLKLKEDQEINYLIIRFSKILVECIENDVQAQNKSCQYSLNKSDNVCIGVSSEYQRNKTACGWCIFKIMTPLVVKIPSFRYSMPEYKDYYNCFNQFYCINNLIRVRGLI